MWSWSNRSKREKNLPEAAKLHKTIEVDIVLNVFYTYKIKYASTYNIMYGEREISSRYSLAMK